jgi:hypothetical protein
MSLFVITATCAEWNIGGYFSGEESGNGQQNNCAKHCEFFVFMFGIWLEVDGCLHKNPVGIRCAAVRGDRGHGLFDVIAHKEMAVAGL